MSRLYVKNLSEFTRELRREGERPRKAAVTAFKRYGFLARKDLAAELRRGQPGGQKLDPLSTIARFDYKKKTISRRKPLSAFAKVRPTPIRYAVQENGGDVSLQIGLLDDGKTSKSWLRLGAAQQRGFTDDISEKQRRLFRLRGAQLKKRGKKQARFFFLKKSTTSLRTPARPFVDPWWTSQEPKMGSALQGLFERKMRGERI